ncbi:hypothetical protein JXI42_11065 [bacterium]|nr:hypothetical protein [bacterium]
MKKKSLKITILSIVVLVIICFLVLFSRSLVGKALLKSKGQFIRLSSDTCILYEPAAKSQAAAIARAYPDAVKRVEEVHGLPFKKPFNVYVCASQNSLNEYVGNPPGLRIRGAVVFNNIYISPTAFDFNGFDTHKETLTHEMSHLHLKHHIGYFRQRGSVPTWFHEGLANFVAGSGGEGISDKEAVKAIMDGHHFIPDDKGRFFKMKRAADYGMQYPMLHKQTKMFVSYMHDSHTSSFKQFLLDVQDRANFADAFQKRFGMDVVSMWDEFEQQLKAAESENDSTANSNVQL